MQRVELFDRESIDQIKWPDSQESRQAKTLPLTLLKEGVERYITNTKTRFYFLRVDDFILPLTVNDKEYNNSYLTSNYYAVKRLREKWPKILYPLVAGIGFILKSAQVNRSVIVNNWLLSNSLYPKLSDEQVELMTHFLAKRFPSHLLMLRSLNETDCSDLLGQLKSLRYHTFFSRSVFMYNPEDKKGKREGYHKRRDLRLMENGGYLVEKEADFARCITLYNLVYRDKHTPFCPHYTVDYLKKAVESDFLEIRVLKRGAETVGVFGFSIRNNTMIVPFFGYDTKLDEKVEIYRILTRLIIEKAEERNVLLNDGSGGDQAKKFRGMKESNEYAAIYARHLPPIRKFFWNLSERCSNLF